MLHSDFVYIYIYLLFFLIIGYGIILNCLYLLTIILLLIFLLWQFISIKFHTFTISLFPRYKFVFYVYMSSFSFLSQLIYYFLLHISYILYILYSLSQFHLVWFSRSMRRYAMTIFLFSLYIYMLYILGYPECLWQNHHT